VQVSPQWSQLADPEASHRVSWPGLLLNGNLLARFQRVWRVTVTRAAGLHAGGVKEISPR